MYPRQGTGRPVTEEAGWYPACPEGGHAAVTCPSINGFKALGKWLSKTSDSAGPSRSARSSQTGSTTCKEVGSKGLILLPGHDEAEMETICKDKTMRLQYCI